jgi:hypothetical protein
MKLIKILKEAPATGTIHVDDVSVEDGIYVAKTEGRKAQYVSIVNLNYFRGYFGGMDKSCVYHTLRDLINHYPDDIFIHIPTGLRATTEKLETDFVLWEDIKDTDALLGCDNDGYYAVSNNQYVFPDYTYYKIVKE